MLKSMVYDGIQTWNAVPHADVSTCWWTLLTPQDTGTRRPLKVVLEHSPAQTTPLCHLDGQKIAAEDVLQAVWQVNADLAKRNEFEFTPLSLKVSWSKVVTMTIIDLPGLKCTQEKCDATAADGTDHRNKIKEIIQQTMKGRLQFVSELLLFRTIGQALFFVFAFVL